jgi:RNA polymerase sigma-70 factor (ECF subfamily)
LEDSLRGHHAIFKRSIVLDGRTPLGSSSQFSAFYERTYLPLFRYLYGLIGGPMQEVEDITCEAFARAWRARRTFQGTPDGALGWVMKIGRSLVIDAYRRSKTRPETQAELSSDVPINNPHPEDSAIQREREAVLFRIIQTLSEKPREIIVLRYLLGWKVSEIAAYLDISENAVSVSIHRSLEHLQPYGRKKASSFDRWRKIWRQEKKKFW